MLVVVFVIRWKHSSDPENLLNLNAAFWIRKARGLGWVVVNQGLHWVKLILVSHKIRKKEDQEDYDEGEGKRGGGGEGEGGEEKEESLRKKRLNTMRAYQLVIIRLLDATG